LSRSGALCSLSFKAQRKWVYFLAARPFAVVFAFVVVLRVLEPALRAAVRDVDAAFFVLASSSFALAWSPRAALLASLAPPLLALISSSLASASSTFAAFDATFVPLFFAFSAPLSTDPASDAFTDGFDFLGITFLLVETRANQTLLVYTLPRPPYRENKCVRS